MGGPQDGVPTPGAHWEVDLVPVPIQVRDEPAARPAAALIVSDGLVLHADLISQPPAEPEAVAGLLARAIASTVDATGVRPPSVCARHWSIAIHLDAAPQLAGARVSVDRLPQLDDAAAELTHNVAGMPKDRPVTLCQPDTWAAWGLSEKTIASLFHSAAVCYQTQPWSVFQDVEIVVAECPSGTEWSVCVMGAAGQQLGLALYEDEGDFEQLFLSSRPGEAFRTAEGMLVSLMFNRRNELPPRMRKEIRAKGWEVAAPQAYPLLFTYNTPGGGFTQSQAEDVCGILDALAAYVNVFGEDLVPAGLTWHHPESRVTLTLVGFEDDSPPVDVPDVLAGAGPAGPGASAEAAIEAHDPDRIRRSHAPLVDAFESALVQAGLSEATVRRHVGNADFLVIFLADYQSIPLHAMTEYDLRIFLHDWCIAKVWRARSDHRAMPVSLKRFLRFVRDREAVFFPWADPILADRERFEDRLDSFPGGFFIDDAVRQWQAEVTLDLAVREFLPGDEMANGQTWGDLMGAVESQLRRELQRRWLLWREEVIASGILAPAEVRAQLIERQRRWETAPHPAHKGITPIEAVMREREITEPVGINRPS